jgi:hypothetical protein
MRLLIDNEILESMKNSITIRFGQPAGGWSATPLSRRSRFGLSGRVNMLQATKAQSAQSLEIQIAGAALSNNSRRTAA